MAAGDLHCVFLKDDRRNYDLEDSPSISSGAVVDRLSVL